MLRSRYSIFTSNGTHRIFPFCSSVSIFSSLSSDLYWCSTRSCWTLGIGGPTPVQYRGVGSSGKKPLCSEGQPFLSSNAKGKTTPFLNDQECDGQPDQDEVGPSHMPQHMNSTRSAADSRASKRNATWPTAEPKSITSESASTASLAQRKMDASVMKREKVDSKGRKTEDGGWCRWEVEGVGRQSEKTNKIEQEETHRGSLSHPLQKEMLRALVQKEKKYSFASSSAIASEKRHVVLGSDRTALSMDSEKISNNKRKKKLRGTASSSTTLWPSKATVSKSSSVVHGIQSTDTVPSGSRKGKKKLHLRASSPAFMPKDSPGTISAGLPSSTTFSSSSLHSSSSLPPHPGYRAPKKWMMVTPSVYYMKVDMFLGEEWDIGKIGDAEYEEDAGATEKRHARAAVNHAESTTYSTEHGCANRSGCAALDTSQSFASEEGKEKKKRKVSPVNVASSSLRLTGNASTPSFSMDVLVRKKYEAAHSREGCNIAKLLVLYRSMHAIFSSLPNQKESLHYVQRMDLPALIMKTRTIKGGNTDNPLLLSPLSLLDHPNDEFIEITQTCLAQRVLVEHTADHFFCIDVRDAEALTPPPHLTSLSLPALSVVPSLSTSTTPFPPPSQDENAKENRKSAKSKVEVHSDPRRRARERSKGTNSGSGTSSTAMSAPSVVSPGSLSGTASTTTTSTSSSTTPSPPIDGHSVDRLKELQAWRFAAFRHAEESLSQLELRPDVHAITRFRVQEPIKIDVTTVESYGGVAKDNAVEAAWDQFTSGQYGIGSKDAKEGEEKNDADSSTLANEGMEDKKSPTREELDVLKSVFSCIFSHPSPSERSQLLQSLFAKGMLSPFVLKPNFTVYGSCLPRREMRLGQPVTPPVLREWIHDDRKCDISAFFPTPGQKSTKEWRKLISSLPSPFGCFTGDKRIGSIGSSSHQKGILDAVEGKGMDKAQKVPPSGAPSPSNASGRRHPSSRHSSDSMGVEQQGEEFYVFSLPRLPRFSTVMTILIDHRGMGLSELMDEKENAVTKKEVQEQPEEQRSQDHDEQRERTASSPFAWNSFREKEGKQCHRANVDASFIASPNRRNGKVIERHSLLPRIYGLVRNGVSIV